MPFSIDVLDRVRMLLFSVANRDTMRSETNYYEIRIGYEIGHLSQAVGGQYKYEKLT